MQVALHSRKPLRRSVSLICIIYSIVTSMDIEHKHFIIYHWISESFDLFHSKKYISRNLRSIVVLLRRQFLFVRQILFKKCVVCIQY